MRHNREGQLTHYFSELQAEQQQAAELLGTPDIMSEEELVESDRLLGQTDPELYDRINRLHGIVSTIIIDGFVDER